MINNRIIVVTALAGIITACSNQTPTPQSQIASPVSVQELKKGSISKLINTTGTVQPIYGVELTSQMSGLYTLQTNPATGKPFKLGDKVTEGQMVIRLDDREYENSISIDSKNMNLDLAEQEQEKQKELYEKGGATLLDTRNSEVKVINARHDVESGTLNLEKMKIKAPFTGVIVNLPYYTPNVKVDQGKPMLGLMNYAQMYMEINMPESVIEYIHSGQPVKITHYTLPEDTISGYISELSPAISAETRTFKGKILIDNNALKLRPGMFVKADIVVDKADDAIIVPKEVVQSNRNRKFVYIVERNTAVLRDIRIGLEDENNVEVVWGLNENDNLVVRGYETLRENSPVKIQK
ncbi:MAG: efflux RND transporter periplasmic adaptor subunit [Bacteroidales bacterium]|jgi:RND family efflux transporter MFP subunit|nr:efflux RND transporter periplasmic adaptor subunit [Bacteroidales bacterium]